MDLDIDILIRKCAQDHRPSQKQFYMLTADKLMNVSRRYAANMDDARDILQNAYVKIFKHIADFDINKGNLDSWLTRIVINEALQLLRKNKLHFNREQEAVETFRTISAPEVMRRLEAEDVLKVTHKLPEGYRIIFNLNVVEGYSHSEIAEKLSISESTSRSQLARAKKMLQDLIVDLKRKELC